jgi:hypothetical protein
MIVVFIGEQETTVEFDSKIDFLARVDGKMLQYTLHLGADGLILEAISSGPLEDNCTIAAAEWGNHPDFEEDA